MSKIIEAWDAAEFRQVADLKLSRFKRKDVRHAISESRYAIKLMEALEDAPMPAKSAEDQSPLNPKVVTILHASLPHHTGGYTGRAQGLLKGMLHAGLDVHPYTRPGFYTEKVDKKAVFPFPSDLIDGVQYRHLPTDFRRAAGEFKYMYQSIDWYTDVFMAEQPDLVHVRSTYLISLPALIAAHRLGIPVLYEISGLWELVYAGRGEKGRARRTAFMEDLACSRADRIVTMNRSMAELLSQRAGRDLKIGLVPNAVDLSRYEKTPQLSEKSTFTYDVGYVGSLVDYEGLDILVRAVASAKAHGQHIKVKIVGKGAEFEPLKELIRQEEVGDLVNLMGPVPADEASRQLDDVNLVVLPRKSTPATECVTPLKPFEAMAARRPLLVSSVGALSELSQSGKFAAVFRAGDVEDLRENLWTLLSDRHRQLELANNAYSLVQHEHDWNNVAEVMSDYVRQTAIARDALPFIQAQPLARKFNNIYVTEN